MTARYSATDYADAGRSLLPRGRVWPADPDSVQGKVLSVIGQAFERSDAASCQLLAGSLPGTGTALMSAWEQTLALTAGGDEAARLRMVRARFNSVGGQSRADYVAFAADLGFTIGIATYRAPRAGENLAGPPYPTSAWPFCWGVAIRANTGSMTPAQLLAELEAIKPAETIVFLLT